MTPPPKEGLDSAQGSTQTLQNEVTSDLFLDLKKMRRENGEWNDADRVVPIEPADQSNRPLADNVDDPESLARSLGVLKDSIVIPVHVERGSQLPPQAEFKVSDQAQTLGDIQAEAVVGMPEQKIEDSLAEQLIERQNMPLVDAKIPGKDFIKNATEQLSGARSLDELKDKADLYAAEGHVVPTEVSQGESWFRAIPGDHQGELFMNILEQARQNLERRSNVDKAKDGVSRAFEVVGDARQARSERKDHDNILKEAHAENDARDHAKEVREEARLTVEKNAAAERGRLIGEERKAQNTLRDEAYAELAAFDRERAQEAEDEALIGPDSFEDFVQQEIDKVIEPIKAEIRRVQSIQSRLMAATDRMPIHDRKELEAQNNHELDGLYKKAAAERKKIIEKTTEDRKGLTKGLREQAAGIDGFEQDLKADKYSYTPDPDMNPEMAALIAGANGTLVGAEESPAYQDEYDIDNGKGNHPTRMQRLVYRTENPSLFVIEDWDKTSGKLKRQSLVKGTNVLISGKENGAKRFSGGRNDIELSNTVYEKLGPITAKSVVSDSDTSSGDGYGSYVRNLTRLGGVGLNKARELADPKRPKNKRTEGFIALLIKNLEQNAKK